MVIERSGHLQRILGTLRRYPVVALVGARQVGKTTLASQVAASWEGRVQTFDLEDARDVARLADPMLALADLAGLVILDEIQHLPEIFRALRVLADRRPLRARFLVLGSAAPELLRQTSETLAGRLHVHELPPLTLPETGTGDLERLWLRGGFPRSFLARTNGDSLEWRQGFIRTFLERDLPGFGVSIPAAQLRRFWTMLAHYHAQTWNGAELARALGLSAPTVRSYLDLLTSAFVVRQLPPWFENMAKRQVRSPKIYIRDSGLLHALLDLGDRTGLERHPKVGASWEGFVLEQLLVRLQAPPEACYFWATHGGFELDLLVVRGRRRLGFEIKRTTAPTLTPSMRNALADLGLERLDVLHAGREEFSLARNVRAVPTGRLLDLVAPRHPPRPRAAGST
ncbi:MAG: ATP-binding protein [Thermoanaerobaculia bacterium]